ncbi:hypothetical protein IWQ60_007270 [Tieghemiomyces parasiticus]|uniref:PITH domain-containing protein n=1 Tax=Tieghemiomyces parasiticus TaxID=78921 RepID=A0A9W8DUM1_9FUNG|nr:hypothetical protein IWQ60_007270 [Tieghemiomyces parasiticus]
MQDLTTVQQFDTAVADSANKLPNTNLERPHGPYQLKFTACPPCRVLSPLLERTSQAYAQVDFYKVQLEKAPAVASAQQGGELVGTVVGANLEGIQDNLQRHAGMPSNLEALTAGPETVGSSTTKPSRPSAYGIPGHSDLSSMVMSTQAGALNQNNDQPLANLFIPGNSYLESDVVKQLFIYLPFNQAVKLHSLKFEGPVSHAPKTVKIYANRPNMGFDETESVQPTQVLELTEADYAELATTSLRFVRFQNVSSITVFVEDNLGGEDITRVQRIIPIGTPIDGAMVPNIRQGGEE